MNLPLTTSVCRKQERGLLIHPLLTLKHTSEEREQAQNILGKKLKLETHIHAMKAAQTLNGAYFLMKIAVHGKVLPGWTGFNTHIHRGPIPLPTNIG